MDAFGGAFVWDASEGGSVLDAYEGGLGGVYGVVSKAVTIDPVFVPAMTSK